MVEHAKCIYQVEVLSEREIDLLDLDVFFEKYDFRELFQKEGLFRPGQDIAD